MPNNKTPNPNYTLFWNALEPYRQPIIDAMKQTDYPKYFGYCPPSAANSDAPSTTANLKSNNSSSVSANVSYGDGSSNSSMQNLGLTPLTENFSTYTPSKSYMSDESCFLLFLLIFLAIFFYLSR